MLAPRPVRPALDADYGAVLSLYERLAATAAEAGRDLFFVQVTNPNSNPSPSLRPSLSVNPSSGPDLNPDPNRDLLLVQNGDLNDGTGLSRVPPATNPNPKP